MIGNHLMRFSRLLPTALLAISSGVQAIEEPGYRVEVSSDAFEVRRYPAYVIAEVMVPGPADQAGNQGFRILADYIFGNNVARTKFKMTAPVIQSAASNGISPEASATTSVKLAMTAPVIQSPAASGFSVQFVMPAQFALADLPAPVDTRVELREQLEHRLAVVRYSGSWSQRNFDDHLALLRQWVKEKSLVTIGEPISARYNAPFVLPFLRRNEIWLKLAD